MLSIDQYFNTVIGLSVLLAIVCAYLVIQVPKYYRLKYIVIPLLFVFVFVSIYHFTDILGRPYHSYPEGEVIIKAYRIAKLDSGEKRIEIWITSKDGSRLYSIPYSEKAAQELAKAMERGKQGQPQVGTFKKKGDGKMRLGYDDQTMELETHPLPNLFETMMKEGESNETPTN